jgi:hypothetical protein
MTVAARAGYGRSLGSEQHDLKGFWSLAPSNLYPNSIGWSLRGGIRPECFIENCSNLQALLRPMIFGHAPKSTPEDYCCGGAGLGWLRRGVQFQIYLLLTQIQLLTVTSK